MNSNYINVIPVEEENARNGAGSRQPIRQQHFRSPNTIEKEVLVDWSRVEAGGQTVLATHPE